MPFTPSITAKPGRQFVLKVSDAVSPTNFVTIGGLRNTQMTLNNNPVDITNAASNGFREYLPDGGVQSFSMSGDGIFDSETTGAVVLFTAAKDRTVIEGQIVSGHGDSFVGFFVVTNFQRNGPYDGAETFSVSLESTGQLAYVEA
jgi:TP901-1 family phage major tail protein